jgi:hypothetical protein
VVEYSHPPENDNTHPALSSALRTETFPEYPELPFGAVIVPVISISVSQALLNLAVEIPTLPVLLTVGRMRPEFSTNKVSPRT